MWKFVGQSYSSANREVYSTLNAYITKQSPINHVSSHFEDLEKQKEQKHRQTNNNKKPQRKRKEIIKSRNQWNWKHKNDRKKSMKQKTNLKIFFNFSKVDYFKRSVRLKKTEEKENIKFKLSISGMKQGYHYRPCKHRKNERFLPTTLHP